MAHSSFWLREDHQDVQLRYLRSALFPGRSMWRRPVLMALCLWVRYRILRECNLQWKLGMGRILVGVTSTRRQKAFVSDCRWVALGQNLVIRVRLRTEDCKPPDPVVWQSLHEKLYCHVQYNTVMIYLCGVPTCVECCLWRESIWRSGGRHESILW